MRADKVFLLVLINVTRSYYFTSNFCVAVCPFWLSVTT